MIRYSLCSIFSVGITRPAYCDTYDSENNFKNDWHIGYTLYDIFIFLRPWNERVERNCVYSCDSFGGSFGALFGGSFDASVCVILLRHHKTPSSPPDPDLPLFFARETQTIAAAAAVAESILVRQQKQH